MFLATIKYKGNLYHLLNYTVPEGQNFIVLESLNSIKENQYPLSIHVLMFIENGDNFILGRGHESDVRISDISVSRSHAKILFKDKKFYLEDTGSKFGTLVLAKDSVTINDNPLIIQIGRSLISIEEVKSDSILYKKNDKTCVNIKEPECVFDCKYILCLFNLVLNMDHLIKKDDFVDSNKLNNLEKENEDDDIDKEF